MTCSLFRYHTGFAARLPSLILECQIRTLGCEVAKKVIVVSKKACYSEYNITQCDNLFRFSAVSLIFTGTSLQAFRAFAVEAVLSDQRQGMRGVYRQPEGKDATDDRIATKVRYRYWIFCFQARHAAFSLWL
jgi:hypothetical protein